MVMRDLDGRATLARVVMAMRALVATVTLDHVVTVTLVRVAMATGAASTLRVRGRVEHPNARRGGFVPVGPTARIVRAMTTRASLMM